MSDQIKELFDRIAPRLTYGGSALTAGSSYAKQNGAPSPMTMSFEEIGIVVGIATAIIGLLMQAYFGWQNLKMKKAAYAKIGVKADAVDSTKGQP